MNEVLKQRLNKIIPRIESKELLTNAGLGNEIGFYIFDYPPEEELEVRKFVRFALDQMVRKPGGVCVAHVNIFRLLIDHLKSRNLLDRALKLQKEKGDGELRRALQGPLHEGKIAKAFVEAADPERYDVVLMTGVGSAWPLLRSHTLLNNLHPLMKSIPLVVFYPGAYDGQALRLFGRLNDNNYYRAFRLVP
jgi:hypothetical protein